MISEDFLQANISTLECLEVIGLSANSLGNLTNEYWAEFCNLLAKCKSLQKIHLNNNDFEKLSSERWQELSLALACCKNLHTIALSSNNLGKLNKNQWQALGSFLVACVNLQNIDLSRNYFNKLTTEQWHILVLSLAKCNNLQSIDLSGNGFNILTNEQWEEVCHVFKNLPRLPSVKLLGCEILPLAKIQQFYNSNLQIVNFPTKSFGPFNDCALNNRYILLRYYSSLVNYLISSKIIQFEKTSLLPKKPFLLYFCKALQCNLIFSKNHHKKTSVISGLPAEIVHDILLKYVGFPHKKIIDNLIKAANHTECSKPLLFRANSMGQLIASNGIFENSCRVTKPLIT
jgi:hypothetical protein